jgi:hypothetical protein
MSELSITEQNAIDAVDDLFHWSQSCTYPTPATLFLDLIGYSEDEFGERLCKEKMPSMGYIEADRLGYALIGYADHPGVVTDHVEALVAKEASE